MPKNTSTPECTGCANIRHCKKNPNSKDGLKKDGTAICHVVAKPALTGAAARRTFGDGGDLNGSPSGFGTLTICS